MKTSTQDIYKKALWAGGFERVRKARRHFGRERTWFRLVRQGLDCMIAFDHLGFPWKRAIVTGIESTPSVVLFNRVA